MLFETTHFRTSLIMSVLVCAFCAIDIVDLRGVSSQAKRIASLWLDHVLALMQLRCHSCGLHQGTRIMHHGLLNSYVAHGILTTETPIPIIS